jgi:transcription elongation factor GreA
MEEPEYLLTKEGAESLRKQLLELKGPGREEIARRLRHAIQQGDLSENANYISAKEDQAFLEGKIQEIETVLRYATIVEDEEDPEIVKVGRSVTVSEEGFEPEVFHIVGVKEADPSAHKISHESPIGKALMGKRVGDTATAHTPSGDLRFKILGIS